jgi:hypothetical protein
MNEQEQKTPTPVSRFHRRKRYSAHTRALELEVESALLAQQVKDLREALAPFTHPDLCRATSGNIEGDKSPVFGRDKATLTLGDFRKAAALLSATANPESK